MSLGLGRIAKNVVGGAFDRGRLLSAVRLPKISHLPDHYKASTSGDSFSPEFFKRAIEVCSKPEATSESNLLKYVKETLKNMPERTSVQEHYLSEKLGINFNEF